jgi:putative glutamine amidotransferase
MTGHKIRIGISGPDRGGAMAWWMSALGVWRCGARPVRISPGRTVDIATLDAFVIGGGTDIAPIHYGEESLPDSVENRRSTTWLDWWVGLSLTVFRLIFARHGREPYDPARDQLEKRLIKYALYNELPTLGICRGAQLMNVVLGGSLHQGIEHFYTEDTGNIRSVLPRKQVKLSSDSRLRRILGVESCYVNALHEQAIKVPGEGVVISAIEPSGVVQAIEKQDHPYFIGVQWHPEYIPQSGRQLRLFSNLVQQAALLKSTAFRAAE